jgi:hypothetical protein
MGATLEDLEAEHARPKETFSELQREHAKLEAAWPVDLAAHAAHCRRLRAHLDDLRAHLDE